MTVIERYRSIRRGYYRRVELGMAAALAVHAAAFVAAPPYVPSPYRLPSPPIQLLVEPARGVESPRRFGPVPLPERAPATPMAGAAAVRTEQLEPVPPAMPSSGGAGSALGSRGSAAGQAGWDESAPPVFYAYDTPPRATRRVTPDYPQLARVEGAEGTVIVNVNVGEDGRILRAWVAGSTAPEILVEAALDAIYQFAFAPATQNDRPVKSTVSLPFKFSLREQSQLIGGK